MTAGPFTSERDAQEWDEQEWDELEMGELEVGEEEWGGEPEWGDDEWGESLERDDGSPTWVEDDPDSHAAAETVDGLVAPFAEEASTAAPTIRRGSRGDAVRRLQQALGAAGHPVAVDGVFGRGTEAAVRAFQSAAGLQVDGVVGARTWQRLGDGGAGDAPPSTAAVGGAAPTDPHAVALGTLVLRAPNRTFDYRFTSDDLVWTAKLLVHEAGGRDDPDNAAVLWAMFNRYALFTSRVFGSFARFVRAYSTTLQPVLRSSGAAARHMHKPPTVFIRTGDTYPGTTIPKGQLKRHLDIQRAPWHTVRPSARALATRALSGQLPNPGIGLASEFASTRIYYRQRHKRNPTVDEWRRFTTELAARKRWRWVGDVPRIDQMKNAFFLDLRAAALPTDAVRVLPSADGAPSDAEVGETEAFGAGIAETGPPAPGTHPSEAYDLESSDIRSDTEEDEEYAFHAKAEDPTADAEWPLDSDHEAAGVVADGFEVEAELESLAAFLGNLPQQIRSALRTGHAHIAVRLLVAGGARDENHLTNMVFHARHPELGGRSIRPGEDDLAAEWIAIRNDVVRPALSAHRDAPRPPSSGGTPTRTRPTVLSSGAIRRAWRDDACRPERMVTVDILGRRSPANRRTIAAWAELDRALRATGYRAERAWVYNCRTIRGSTARSLHAYGLAVDIDPPWNPNRRTPDRRPVRFSTAATQQARLADVRAHVADTVFTLEQVAAVEAIRTVEGHRVFGWGGRWNTIKDTMHFQISVTPEELARGLA